MLQNTKKKINEQRVKQLLAKEKALLQEKMLKQSREKAILLSKIHKESVAAAIARAKEKELADKKVKEREVALIKATARSQALEQIVKSLTNKHIKK